MKLQAEVWTNKDAAKGDVIIVLWDYSKEHCWKYRKGAWSRGNRSNLIQFGWFHLTQESL